MPSSDAVVLRQARDKAKAIGDLAAVARRVVALAGFAKPRQVLAAAAPEAEPEPATVFTQAEHALRALEKLKGRHRR